MESYLARMLDRTGVKRTGRGGGGCISQGEILNTDQGAVYVKENSNVGSKIMFTGEMAGLHEMEKSGTIRVPHPICVLDRPTGPGSILVMEVLCLSSCSSSNLQTELGTCMAKMHIANKQGTEGYVDRYGFSVGTCCGSLEQGNGWSNDWGRYYVTKLEEQINRQTGDKELVNIWPRLQTRVLEILSGLEIRSSLLHGDLWSGNVGCHQGHPVVFDPACFYGHSEYDLAISDMFGGFSQAFYSAYHNIIPRTEGFDERQDLYKLFHYLNHWNHFGGGYRGQSMTIIRRIVK